VNDPVRVGEVLGEVRTPVRIPKRCPECGAEYEGWSFIGLRPGEERAVYPCDLCQLKAEAAARAREAPRGPEPVTELRRPEYVRRDWEGPDDC
jgi:hypothetical protein